MRNADQHGSVQEFHRLRDKTNSKISIKERIEKKRYNQCTVEVYQFFSEMGFYYLSA